MKNKKRSTSSIILLVAIIFILSVQPVSAAWYSPITDFFDFFKKIFSIGKPDFQGDSELGTFGAFSDGSGDGGSDDTGSPNYIEDPLCMVDKDCGDPDNFFIACEGNNLVSGNITPICLDKMFPMLARCAEETRKSVIQVCDPELGCYAGKCITPETVICIMDRDCGGTQFRYKKCANSTTLCSGNTTPVCNDPGTTASRCQYPVIESCETCAYGCSSTKLACNCINDLGCSQEGKFCAGDVPYSCALGKDGCLDRTNGTLCATFCSDGVCALPGVSNCKEDLVLHIKFNGSLLDSSRYNHKVNYFGKTALNEAFYGKTFSFDGVDDYLSIEGSNCLNFTTNDFTYCAWIKVKNEPLVNLYPILSKKPSSGYNFFINANAQLQASLNDGDNIFSYGDKKVNDNYWHHVCAVYDRDVGLTLYFGGYQDKILVNISNASGSINNSGALYIGRNEAGSYFKGVMSDLRVYRKALSYYDIEPLSETMPNYCTDECVKPYCDSRGYFQYNCSNYDTSNPCLEGSTSTYCPEGCFDGACVKTSDCTDPLLLDLKFDNTSYVNYDTGSYYRNLLKDNSKYNHNITSFGGETYSTGISTQKDNLAYNFDGIDDYLVINNSKCFNFTTNDFAYCAWIKMKTEPLSKGYFILSKKPSTGYNFWINPNAQVQASLNDGDNVLSYGYSQVNNSYWHYVCANYDRDVGLTLYVDGKLDKELVNISLASASINNSDGLYIGRNDAGNYFKGAIDELKIYRRTLINDGYINELEGGYYPDGGTCTPKDCYDLGVICGNHSDGCGHIINCSVGGICPQILAGSNDYCLEHIDCNTTSVCNMSGRCAEQNCDPSRISSSRECPKWYQCVDNRSIFKSICIRDRCSNNLDCKSGYNCENGTCIYRYCESNKNCSEGYVCSRENLCQEVECKDDKGCDTDWSKGYYSCDNGLCVYSACSIDMECTGNQTCQDGKCEDPGCIPKSCQELDAECGEVSTNCGGKLIWCGGCMEDEVCNETSKKCEQGGCVLSNPRWVADLLRPNTVHLLVEGTNCEGELVNFAIYEKDLWFNDPLNLSLVPGGIGESRMGSLTGLATSDLEMPEGIVPVGGNLQELVTKIQNGVAQLTWFVDNFDNLFTTGDPFGDSEYTFTAAPYGNPRDYVETEDILIRSSFTMSKSAPSNYYPFDSDAKDSVSGNDGEVVGAELAPGVACGGYKFDGDSYIALPKIYESQEIGKVSACFWIKTDKSGPMPVLDFDQTKYWGISVNGGKISFTTTSYNGPDARSPPDSLGGNIRVDDNKWHHVCVSYGPKEGKTIYIDGELDATGPINGKLGTGIRRYGFVGAPSQADSFYGEHGDIYFNGALDEVMIFDNIEISPDSVLYYYVDFLNEYRGKECLQPFYVEKVSPSSPVREDPASTTGRPYSIPGKIVFSHPIDGSYLEPKPPYPSDGSIIEPNITIKIGEGCVNSPELGTLMEEYPITLNPENPKEITFMLRRDIVPIKRFDQYGVYFDYLSKPNWDNFKNARLKEGYYTWDEAEYYWGPEFDPESWKDGNKKWPDKYKINITIKGGKYGLKSTYGDSLKGNSYSGLFNYWDSDGDHIKDYSKNNSNKFLQLEGDFKISFACVPRPTACGVPGVPRITGLLPELPEWGVLAGSEGQAGEGEEKIPFTPIQGGYFVDYEQYHSCIDQEVLIERIIVPEYNIPITPYYCLAMEENLKKNKKYHIYVGHCRPDDYECILKTPTIGDTTTKPAENRVCCSWPGEIMYSYSNYHPPSRADMFCEAKPDGKGKIDYFDKRYCSRDQMRVTFGGPSEEKGYIADSFRYTQGDWWWSYIPGPKRHGGLGGFVTGTTSERTGTAIICKYANGMFGEGCHGFLDYFGFSYLDKKIPDALTLAPWEVCCYTDGSIVEGMSFNWPTSEWSDRPAAGNSQANLYGLLGSGVTADCSGAEVQYDNGDTRGTIGVACSSNSDYFAISSKYNALDYIPKNYDWTTDPQGLAKLSKEFRAKFEAENPTCCNYDQWFNALEKKEPNYNAFLFAKRNQKKDFPYINLPEKPIQIEGKDKEYLYLNPSDELGLSFEIPLIEGCEEKFELDESVKNSEPSPLGDKKMEYVKEGEEKTFKYVVKKGTEEILSASDKIAKCKRDHEKNYCKYYFETEELDKIFAKIKGIDSKELIVEINAKDDLGSENTYTSKATNILRNKKDPAKFQELGQKPVFLISDGGWESAQWSQIFKTISAVMWQDQVDVKNPKGLDPWCNKIFSTKTGEYDKCGSPLLIYHYEQTGFDWDTLETLENPKQYQNYDNSVQSSIFEFVSDYSPDNIWIIDGGYLGNSGYLLESLASSRSGTSRTIPISDLRNYFWESVGAYVVVPGDDYRAALLGSQLAAYFNAPLRFSNEISGIKDKLIIAVGEGLDLSELQEQNIIISYDDSLHYETLSAGDKVMPPTFTKQSLQEYFKKLNPGEVAVINPNDIQQEYCDTITQGTNTFTSAYCRMSMAAPILAFGEDKQTLFIETPGAAPSHMAVVNAQRNISAIYKEIEKEIITEIENKQPIIDQKYQNMNHESLSGTESEEVIYEFESDFNEPGVTGNAINEKILNEKGFVEPIRTFISNNWYSPINKLFKKIFASGKNNAITGNSITGYAFSESFNEKISEMSMAKQIISDNLRDTNIFYTNSVKGQIDKILSEDENPTYGISPKGLGPGPSYLTELCSGPEPTIKEMTSVDNLHAGWNTYGNFLSGASPLLASSMHLTPTGCDARNPTVASDEWNMLPEVQYIVDMLIDYKEKGRKIPITGEEIPAPYIVINDPNAYSNEIKERFGSLEGYEIFLAKDSKLGLYSTGYLDKTKLSCVLEKKLAMPYVVRPKRAPSQMTYELKEPWWDTDVELEPQQQIMGITYYYIIMNRIKSGMLTGIEAMDTIDHLRTDNEPKGPLQIESDINIDTPDNNLKEPKIRELLPQVKLKLDEIKDSNHVLASDNLAKTIDTTKEVMKRISDQSLKYFHAARMETFCTGNPGKYIPEDSDCQKFYNLNCDLCKQKAQETKDSLKEDIYGHIALVPWIVSDKFTKKCGDPRTIFAYVGFRPSSSSDDPLGSYPYSLDNPLKDPRNNIPSSGTSLYVPEHYCNVENTFQEMLKDNRNGVKEYIRDAKEALYCMHSRLDPLGLGTKPYKEKDPYRLCSGKINLVLQKSPPIVYPNKVPLKGEAKINIDNLLAYQTNTINRLFMVGDSQMGIAVLRGEANKMITDFWVNSGLVVFTAGFGMAAAETRAAFSAAVTGSRAVSATEILGMAAFGADFTWASFSIRDSISICSQAVGGGFDIPVGTNNPTIIDDKGDSTTIDIGPVFTRNYQSCVMAVLSNVPDFASFVPIFFKAHVPRQAQAFLDTHPKAGAVKGLILGAKKAQIEYDLSELKSLFEKNKRVTKEFVDGLDSYAKDLQNLYPELKIEKVFNQELGHDVFVFSTRPELGITSEITNALRPTEVNGYKIVCDPTIDYSRAGPYTRADKKEVHVSVRGWLGMEQDPTVLVKQQSHEGGHVIMNTVSAKGRDNIYAENLKARTRKNCAAIPEDSQKFHFGAATETSGTGIPASELGAYKHAINFMTRQRLKSVQKSLESNINNLPDKETKEILADLKDVLEKTVDKDLNRLYEYSNYYKLATPDLKANAYGVFNDPDKIKWPEPGNYIGMTPFDDRNFKRIRFRDGSPVTSGGDFRSQFWVDAETAGIKQVPGSPDEYYHDVIFTISGKNDYIEIRFPNEALNRADGKDIVDFIVDFENSNSDVLDDATKADIITFLKDKTGPRLEKLGEIAAHNEAGAKILMKKSDELKTLIDSSLLMPEISPEIRKRIIDKIQEIRDFAPDFNTVGAIDPNLDEYLDINKKEMMTLGVAFEKQIIKPESCKVLA